MCLRVHAENKLKNQIKRIAFMSMQISNMLMPIDTALSFQEKENRLFCGLVIYLRGAIGDYLSEEQITTLAESLRRMRNRPADIEYADDLCAIVSEESEIRHKFIPRKLLRKDEGSVLFYNLAPYALIGRKQAACFAKKSLPNFFASVATVNSTFTKFSRIPGSEIDRAAELSIMPFREHSTHAVETFLYNLGMNNQI